jgi:hypothetical protein
MSSKKIKSILKKGTPFNTTKKRRITIDTNLNRVDSKIPEPLTDSLKRDLWSTNDDVKLARKTLNEKKKLFNTAHRSLPELAAREARKKFNITLDNSISIPKSNRSRALVTTYTPKNPSPEIVKKGSIRKIISSIGSLFRSRKGGKKNTHTTKKYRK